MTVVESYAAAVVMCVITMLCWGSWANTQKLASKEWRFELFYWDYAIGVLLFALVLAFTLGQHRHGRAQLPRRHGPGGATERSSSAFVGGVVFNLSNILLVAAIDIAGMAVAFPIGVGLALVLGVITNYMASPVGNPVLLFLGRRRASSPRSCCRPMSYSRLPAQGQRTIGKGIVVSVVAGLLMGFFYRFVAASMSTDFINLEPGKLGPVQRHRDVLGRAAGLELPVEHHRDEAAVRRRAGDLRRLLLEGLAAAAPDRHPRRRHLEPRDVAQHHRRRRRGVRDLLRARARAPRWWRRLWGVFIWKEFKDAPAGTSPTAGADVRGVRRRPHADRRRAPGLSRGAATGGAGQRRPSCRSTRNVRGAPKCVPLNGLPKFSA